jgi:hypothetical protein
MRLALEAIRSADANRKPLVYAPWVVSLALLVVLRGQASSLGVDDWIKAGVAMALLPLVCRWGMSRLAKQKRRAEDDLIRQLRDPRGIHDWNRLQENGAYLGLRISDSVQHAVVDAARAQEARDEEKRFRAEREKVIGRRETEKAGEKAAEKATEKATAGSRRGDPVLSR